MRRKSILYFVIAGLVMVVVFTDFNSIKKLYITTFHKSGMISYYSTKDRLDGEVDTYIDGKIKSKEFFKDGMRDGPNTLYYPSGRIELKSFRKKGKVEGLEYEYYEEGNIRCRRNWINNKPYGDFYYYYPDKKVEVYHTYDIMGDKFYLCRYDKSGNILKNDGYVFSNHTYTIDHDSVEILRDSSVYKSIKDLYITVANPPQVTPEIRVIINSKLCQNLVFPNRNTVMIRNAFDKKGLYSISIEGVFASDSGMTDHTTGILRIIKN